MNVGYCSIIGRGAQGPGRWIVSGTPPRHGRCLFTATEAG